MRGSGLCFRGTWFALLALTALTAAACGARTWDLDGYAGQSDAVGRVTTTGDSGLTRDAPDDSSGIGLGDGTTLPAEASPACRAGRWVLTGQVRNARDLGGVPLGSGVSVPCGSWFRGSALANLSPQGCTELEQLGIRTVVDLRTSAERSSTPQSSCVDHIVHTIWAPMPTPYSVSPADYVADLTTADSIVKAFDALGDANAYPVYFHCVYGRDRTGVLAVVILLTLGASEDDIMAEYQLTEKAGMSVYPNSLRAALAEVTRLGGVDAYLESMGVSPNRVAALRSRVGVGQR